MNKNRDLYEHKGQMRLLSKWLGHMIKDGEEDYIKTQKIHRASMSMATAKRQNEKPIKLRFKK